ncbi:MAG: 3-isopropylmalate dehydrogenase, partial [Anaerolineae bacterium]|nr:3-isopropylmalate dehydrogenase [Anaerolineae bacterium]
LEQEAVAIEEAVDAVLADGLRTADIARKGEPVASTGQFTDAVIAKLQA